MPKYVVMSKSNNGKNWLTERSYMLKSYADDVAKSIRKSGRLAKVVKK